MALKDNQLLYLFKNILSHHNGFRCGRVRKEGICPGETTIMQGKLKFLYSCGEPCSFVCENAKALDDDITLLQQCEIVIELAKKERI